MLTAYAESLNFSADAAHEKCRLLTSAATAVLEGGAMGTSRPTPLSFGFADLEADEAADGDFVTELLADASDVVAH